MVRAKRHNFTIDEKSRRSEIANSSHFDISGPDPENDVEGEAEIAVQVVPCNRLDIRIRQVLVYLDPQPGKDP
jgi:hypothetical protein